MCYMNKVQYPLSRSKRLSGYLKTIVYPKHCFQSYLTTKLTTQKKLIYRDPVVVFVIQLGLPDMLRYRDRLLDPALSIRIYC
jgi:hypothetical protein